MKVKMKVQISGTRDGKDWPKPGGTVDVPDHEGKELCSADLAEPVAQKSDPETRPAKSKAETRK